MFSSTYPLKESSLNLKNCLNTPHPEVSRLRAGALLCGSRAPGTPARWSLDRLLIFFIYGKMNAPPSDKDR